MRDAIIPLKTACEALDVPRSTVYRHLKPKPKVAPQPRPRNRRRIPDQKRAEIIALLHSHRFIDQTPRQVYGELLDEEKYVASVRTFYRVLAEQGETRERRNQRRPRHNAVPRLVATKPNAVWTWDITKLPTYTPGTFLNLYLILDLFSRYPVAWMVAERENCALAKQLVSTAYTRHRIQPGEVTLHNDRGAPMTALGFTELLAELHVTRSVSRPRVSNDNPFSESAFKTLKYQPDYPGRFQGLIHARAWCHDFLIWYAEQHRHSGLALFTPADVFYGRVPELATIRQKALDAAYALHPERFINGAPRVALPPKRVTINPLDPGDATTTTCARARMNELPSQTAARASSIAPVLTPQSRPDPQPGAKPPQTPHTL
jgi:putative transposase